MVASAIPKTKFEELTDYLARIRRSSRENALQELSFLSRRVDLAASKKDIATEDRLILKAVIAAYYGDFEELCSYTSGLRSFHGIEGRQRQFSNFLQVGFLHDAYELIKDIKPEGQEFTLVAWLSLVHAMNGDFTKAMDCLDYAHRAYPNSQNLHETQCMMANTAAKLVEVLNAVDQPFSITRAIQNALKANVPKSMLSLPGVDYISASIDCSDSEEVMIELRLLPTPDMYDKLTDMNVGFSRAIQTELTGEITDVVMIGLSFYDEDPCDGL